MLLIIVMDNPEIRQAAFAESCNVHPPYMMYGEHVHHFPRPIGTEMTDAVALTAWDKLIIKYWGSELNETVLLNEDTHEQMALWWQNWLYFLNLPPNSDNAIRMALLGIQSAVHLLGTTVTSQLLVPYVKVNYLMNPIVK